MSILNILQPEYLDFLQLTLIFDRVSLNQFTQT